MMQQDAEPAASTVVDASSRPISAKSRAFLRSAPVRLLLAVVVALALLKTYQHRKIQADQFALEDGSYSMVDTWRGRQISEWRMASVDGFIQNLTEGLKSAPSTPVTASPARKNVMMLGFSQLHVINQYKQGDHLTPYWLMENAGCDGCLQMASISLPNANFQEYYLVAANLLSRTPTGSLSAAVLNLPFDKLRNDGIRDELAPLMTEATRSVLARSEIGRLMVKEWDARPKVGAMDESAGLQGFVQQSLEDKLTGALSRVSDLWADRVNLRSAVLVDLYFLRNAMLGIKPSSTRKMVRPRYERNMKALEAMLEMLAAAHVPVLAYVAPIRSDVPPPYDPAEFAAWQAELGQLSAARGFKLLHLDKSVPGRYWGRTNGDWVDYMHFEGEGHKIVAAALLPDLMRIVDAPGH